MATAQRTAPGDEVMIWIDYEEFKPSSYRAVVCEAGETLRFESGDPVKDWNDCMAELARNEWSPYCSSIVDNFLSDAPDYLLLRRGDYGLPMMHRR